MIPSLKLTEKINGSKMKFPFGLIFRDKLSLSFREFTVKPINRLNLWMFRLVTTQTLTSMQLIRPSFFSRHKSLSLLMMRWRNTAAGADGGPTPVSRGVSSQAVFWLEKPKTRNLQFHHQMMFAKRKKTPLFWLLNQKKEWNQPANYAKLACHSEPLMTRGSGGVVYLAQTPGSKS